MMNGFSTSDPFSKGRRKKTTFKVTGHSKIFFYDFPHQYKTFFGYNICTFKTPESPVI